VGPGDTAPQGMPHHAASIGLLLLLAATVSVPENNLNIPGESPATHSPLIPLGTESV